MSKYEFVRIESTKTKKKKRWCIILKMMDKSRMTMVDNIKAHANEGWEQGGVIAYSDNFRAHICTVGKWFDEEPTQSYIDNLVGEMVEGKKKIKVSKNGRFKEIYNEFDPDKMQPTRTVTILGTDPLTEEDIKELDERKN